MDVGPKSTRSRLHPTTNGSESQNRVIKFDDGFHRLPPRDALKSLLKLHEAKDRAYQLALSGYRALMDPKPLETPRKRSRQEDQGPPKTVKAYQKSLKANKSSATVKSFPVWRWHKNSCAIDAVLATIFFGIRSLPEEFQVTNTPTGMLRTRSEASSATGIRASSETICERLAQVWASALDSQALENQLAEIRDEFRSTISPAVPQFDTSNYYGFMSASNALYIICKSFVIPISGMTHPFQLTERNLTQEHVARRKFSSLQQYLFDGAKGVPRVDQRSLFVLFYFDSNIDKGSRPDCENLELPIILSDASMRFKFLACIDCNGTHFRTHVLYDNTFAFRVNQKTVKEGLYLIDTMAVTRVRRTSDVPDNNAELKAALPSFTRKQFRPHVFIYRRDSSQTGI